MEIYGLTFIPRSGYFFTNLDQGLSQKVGIFLILEPILQAGFLDKMLALSNMLLFFLMETLPRYLCLRFELSWLLYFYNFAQILFERSLFHQN